MIKKVTTDNWELSNLLYNDDIDGYCIDIMSIELNFQFKLAYTTKEKNKLGIYIPLEHHLEHGKEYNIIKPKLAKDINELNKIIQCMIVLESHNPNKQQAQ